MCVVGGTGVSFNTSDDDDEDDGDDEGGGNDGGGNDGSGGGSVGGGDCSICCTNSGMSGKNV